MSNKAAKYRESEQNSEEDSLERGDRVEDRDADAETDQNQVTVDVYAETRDESEPDATTDTDTRTTPIPVRGGRVIPDVSCPACGTILPIDVCRGWNGECPRCRRICSPTEVSD